MEISELKERLKKKEEECKSMKATAQGLTQRVDLQYKDEITKLKEANLMMNE